MDRITHYRALLKTLFHDYQRLYNLQPTPGVEAHCIFDETRDHYLLIDLGWKGEKRVKRIILYVRLVDGKYSIEEDWTEEEIAADLLRACVPQEDIVLAFQPPSTRASTELAVA